MGNLGLNYASPFKLVVGADGLIGSALIRHLRAMGEPVIGTTRRHQQVDDSHLFLDLSEQQGQWLCPCRIDVAVICAGIAKLEDCRRDPTGTAYLNVVKIVELANHLVSRGAFVIYLSSNAVFDGSVPYSRPDDAISPVTEYGRQKAQAESRLLELGNLVSVVRFTKILGPQTQPFKEWTQALRTGKPIHPFSDMVLAPVSLDFAVNVLHQVANKRLSGIVQVSGKRDVSYAGAARLGARYLGVDEDLVRPVKRSRLHRCVEPIPAHTSLNTDRLQAALAIEPPDIKSTIQSAFAISETLAD
jgi:dTDP-4-dehydrorhamnose reductase